MIDTLQDAEYTTTKRFGALPMETIFLACFAIGLLFTIASFALGMVGGGLGHIGAHLGGHLGGAHIGGAHVGGAGHIGGAHAGGGHVGGHDLPENAQLPLLNASSVIGGLTWFGAAGYLLVHLGDWALPAALVGALAVGAVGWYLVARFLGLVLKGEVEMDPADYRLEGKVGQVTVAIPASGTGEVVYEMAGSRRSEAARALDGAAIPRGTEVVITAYADGFATVQPWNEFLAERDRLKLSVPSEQKEA